MQIIIIFNFNFGFQMVMDLRRVLCDLEQMQLCFHVVQGIMKQGWPLLSAMLNSAFQILVTKPFNHLQIA